MYILKALAISCVIRQCICLYLSLFPSGGDRGSAALRSVMEIPSGPVDFLVGVFCM